MSSVSKGDVAMTNDGDDNREVPITLDLPKARQNFGSDETLLQEIAMVFIEDVPGIATELEAACLRNDYQTVARLAHSLKGLCATFGAEPSRTIAQRLELDAVNCRSAVSMEKISALIDALHLTILTLQTELRLSA